MSKFMITSKNNEYQFELKTDNGQIILSSDGHTCRGSCLNNIETIKKNITDESMFQKITSPDDKFYYNLTLPNGKIVAKSKMFDPENESETSIQQLKKNVSQAYVVDYTLNEF